MKTMSVGEFKAHFSEVLKLVIAGEEVGIQYGKKKEIVAKMVLPKSIEKKPRRNLGILEGKGTIEFEENFKISPEDFLELR